MNSPECFKLAEDQRNPSCYEAPEQASLDMAYIARQHPHLPPDERMVLACEEMLQRQD